MPGRDRSILDVTWEAIEAWVSDLSAEAMESDVIIGVARGGAPIATALAYRCPDAVLSFATNLRRSSTSGPFFVFEGDRDRRIETLHLELHIAAFDPGARVLVVDDVATFGDTLSVVEAKLEPSGPESIRFATYAADLEVLSHQRPSVSARLSYCIEVDNSRDWLRFPWEPGAMGGSQ